MIKIIIEIVMLAFFVGLVSMFAWNLIRMIAAKVYGEVWKLRPNKFK